MPRIFILTCLCVLFSAVQAMAEPEMPPARYVVTPDTDLYGSDLDSLFDSSLSACQRACSTNPRCVAFTFNARSNACFPKSAVGEQSEFEGAVSAVKVTPGADARKLAATRWAELTFLGDADLKQATKAALNVGFWHRAGAFETQVMLDAARARASDGAWRDAMRWMGGAVAATDRSDLWAEYARMLLRVETDNRSARRTYEGRAISAALNAYMRAGRPGGQASALEVLAQALERNGRGRDMIPALRLAQSLAPRDDIATALHRAIGKYGFRVVNTKVENDSASPRICAEFSEALVKSGTDYDPFVTRPEAGLAVQADGAQLCLDGVEHGKRYRFVLRKGLPAASGETLYRDSELTLYVRDRKPSVRFPGRSYVLPKTADAALPVETVNVTKLDLTLRRVSDRNLLRAVQDGYFGRPLSQYQSRLFSNEIAEDLWTGTAEVSGALNRDALTRLPMTEAIAGLPAGIYALSAAIPGADPYDDPAATQWFVLSDLGISTMQGSDGLLVDVRGLSDAKPRAGVTVTLVSRANAVLARAETGADGTARFAPGLTRGTGGAAPAMVLADKGDSDLGFLSLTDPAFDLSDRGVEGRAPAGPVDVFLATDRGAYRAGETIHATVLTRDPQAQAVEGLPVTAILHRPDGVEYSRHVSDGGRAGGHVFHLPVGTSAPRGTWRLDIKADPDAPALASQRVLVEDFLPERIDFDLSLPAGPLRATDRPTLSIDARYLFGAPGAGLRVEGEVILRPATEVAGWPGYHFGRHDARPDPMRSSFTGEPTDAAGQGQVRLKLPVSRDQSLPMEATIVTRLADAGARPVERRLTTPVLPGTAVIGIKPRFDDVLAEGQEAGFDLIALAPDLQLTAMSLRWTLNRVETRYQWYQQYGDWNWEPTTRRTRIATGELDLNGAPVGLEHPVDWGEYELVVERTDGAYVAASVSFYAGWYAPADASATPDRLELSLDKPSYQVGETAQLRIVPRMAGTALISVLSDRVISRQAVEVEAGESLIPIPVGADWGAGAYVSATMIRPMDAAAGRNPARALGLAHAAVTPEARRLRVAIETPEQMEPRQTLTAGLRVDGAQAGDEVYVSLAAVDLGILNLTGFQSPDPQGYYFGQRRLGVELRDVYGRLIDGMNGAMGTVRSGGDGDRGLRRQSPPPTQELMAVFEGPVRVGADGRASVDVELPAFNGTVRLMAVAWSPRAVGQAERDVLVRDPVVLRASLPRFLAPGDQARIRLEAIHAGGPVGTAQLRFEAVGAGLTLGEAPQPFALSQGGKAVFDIPVEASLVGDPGFDLVLTTPDGRELRQSLTLPVRANDPPVATTQRFSLAGGDAFTFSDDVFTGLRVGTGTAFLSAGPMAQLDAPGLLAALDRYPYGCTEQLTSQALPLLYLADVAQAMGLGNGPAVRARVDEAIARILTRQAANGSFGMWRARSGEFWLDAYVTDFLSRARANGYAVPDRAFRTALDNLRNRVNFAPDFEEGGTDLAYALFVLAREGAAAMGDLRYYADVKADEFGTPLALAQLGGALAAYGDQTRADAMFARAARRIDRQRGDEARLWRADFGTRLRDTAGVLALAVEARSTAIDAETLSARVAARGGAASTQEAAWSLMAAQALIANPEQSGLLVDGAPVAGPFVRVLEDRGLSGPVQISAASGTDTQITLTTLGVPLDMPPAGGNGYAIERVYFDMDGAPLDGESFEVGARFVTVLTVTPFGASDARLMIDDPLPAGIEIDNPNLLRSGDLAGLDWLTLSGAEHTEFRSDRFLAALDWRGGKPVTLAYVARAVTPGAFHHPAASVEDMYRPAYRAHTDTRRIFIRE